MNSRKDVSSGYGDGVCTSFHTIRLSPVVCPSSLSPGIWFLQRAHQRVLREGILSQLRVNWPCLGLVIPAICPTFTVKVSFASLRLEAPRFQLLSRCSCAPPSALTSSPTLPFIPTPTPGFWYHILFTAGREIFFFLSFASWWAARVQARATPSPPSIFLRLAVVGLLCPLVPQLRGGLGSSSAGSKLLH